MQKKRERRRGKSTQNKYVPGKNKTNSFTRKDKRATFKLTMRSVVSIALLIVQIAIVCLIGYVVVYFYGQRLSNTGEAMRPTLGNGEVVMVDRLVYNAITPRRGHVVAFRPHGNENANIAIRRVVAVAGETIQIVDGKIYIDEEEMSFPYLGEHGVEYAGLAVEPIVLEANEFFVIGDNHLSSIDSRMADIGIVRRSDLYGRVWFTLGDDMGFIR
jgi:signal peptidase I